MAVQGSEFNVQRELEFKSLKVAWVDDGAGAPRSRALGSGFEAVWSQCFTVEMRSRVDSGGVLPLSC